VAKGFGFVGVAEVKALASIARAISGSAAVGVGDDVGGG